ncbi:MAG: glycoside hydrolase family 3 C-terminal domain-containing protein [Bacteroidales bacterium]|jgi:beta-glucosidase
MNKIFKISILLLYIGVTASGLSAQEAAGKILYTDPSQPVSTRVADLVSRMTLEEKISQMQHTAPAIDRLGIPAYNWWNEALHGVARNGIATVFPQAIGMAATWNSDLINQEADIISTEARAKYAEAISKKEHNIYQGLTFWSPNINIFRDPRWGRGQETYGEDPYLTAQIGVAFVKGLQGKNDRYFKVIATAKHFAVHSGPESSRHTFDAWPSETDLYETYLPAFEALVRDGKVNSFMGAYNRVYGTPSCASDFLLVKTLREKWGFKGYVVSDCWAISDFYKFHKFVPDAAKASALAVKAGTDLSCGGEYGELVEAVKLGYISEAEIDVSVKRLFTARMKLGMFDPQEMVPYASIKPAENNTEAHRRFARKVAQESIVLLKNEKSTLPISNKVKSIAVIGPYADELSVLLGNYNGDPTNPVTLLQGIKNRAGKKIRVNYALGVDQPEKLAQDTARKKIQSTLETEALQLVMKSDFVVFVGGISPELEGEEMPVKVDGFSGGDKTHLDMPKNQEGLLQKIYALKKPVVLVLTNGSALSINWAKENIPAIIDCWYPGEEGGNAVADVLFGDYNPAGRLPVTFYKSISDIPAFDNYSMEGKTYRYFKGAPLYAFGYGLSYTNFDYSKFSAENKTLKTGEALKLNVVVTNSGKFDGDEVVQVYAVQPGSVSARPIKSLVAFQRVHLKKGESRVVNLTVSPVQLRHFDTKLGDYSIAGGIFEFQVGAASNDIRGTVMVEMTTKK